MEKYEFPIKFNESERLAYAKWGIRKERVIMPMALVTITLYLITAVWVVGWVWLIRDTDALWFYIVVQSGWIAKITGFLAAILTVMLIKPIDFILDKIWHRPDNPIWFRVILSEETIEVNKISNFKTALENILSTETYPLLQFEKHIDDKENAFLFQGKWYLVGENTIESIYPAERQNSWMDYPTTCVGCITDVKKLSKIISGYIDALEIKRKEQEWLVKNIS